MVVHAFKPALWEVEAGIMSTRQPRLHSETLLKKKKKALEI